ncbi:MAG: dienelactone hydrolase family protein [Gemmatimonadaceae bacterium]|nr:dienelactone hydrolase family protein [Chitinophagaceae bacterium]
MMFKALNSIMAMSCCVLMLVSCQKDKVEETTTDTVQIKKPKLPVNPVGGTDPNDVAETAPANQVAVNLNVGGNIGGFYRALPARYDLTTKKYPLMIFIHGVGELGNGTSQLGSVLNNGVPKLLNERRFPAQFTVNGANHSFIVFSPQFKAWPSPADVNAMVDYAVANYRVDPTRIYVSGLSMGGGITWDYGIAYSSRVAAIAPICGAAWPTQASCANIANDKVPVWAFHNEDDGTVTANTTRMIVDFINSFNANPVARHTIWPNGGHNSWTRATDPNTKDCDGKNMYEWMLQYKN